MPNWVFNNLYDYDKELYDKYSSNKLAIDFNKVIPEPEDIKKTTSGSYNDIAKAVYNYKNYIDEIDNDKSHHLRPIQCDNNNPLKSHLDTFVSDVNEQVAGLVIENPDKTLNDLLSVEDKHKPFIAHTKRLYDDYVDMFGNTAFKNIKDYRKAYDSFCKFKEDNYNKYVSKRKDNPSLSPENEFDGSLAEYGELLINNKEKYGFEDWYGWRNANWGTKWNASDSDYDKETQTLTFNTAWSIPYQILTKIAKDNPDKKFSGYSEEETGWFDEYHANKGMIVVDNYGEEEYDEEKDEYVRNSQPDNRVLEFDSYLKKEQEYWENAMNIRYDIS